MIMLVKFEINFENNYQQKINIYIASNEDI